MLPECSGQTGSSFSDPFTVTYLTPTGGQQILCRSSAALWYTVLHYSVLNCGGPHGGRLLVRRYFEQD